MRSAQAASKRPNGLSELGIIIACLQDIASGLLSGSVALSDLQMKRTLFAACRRFSVPLSSQYGPVLACYTRLAVQGCRRSLQANCSAHAGI